MTSAPTAAPVAPPPIRAGKNKCCDVVRNRAGRNKVLRTIMLDCIIPSENLAAAPSNARIAVGGMDTTQRGSAATGGSCPIRIVWILLSGSTPDKDALGTRVCYGSHRHHFGRLPYISQWKDLLGSAGPSERAAGMGALRACLSPSDSRR